MLLPSHLMTRQQCSAMFPSVVAALHRVPGRHRARVELRDWRGEPSSRSMPTLLMQQRAHRVHLNTCVCTHQQGCWQTDTCLDTVYLPLGTDALRSRAR
jgi:hypothetical protein